MVWLLGVTEECNASQDPVIWSHVAAQTESRDVGQVGTAWFLVDWADVGLGIFHVILHVDGKDVHDGNLDEKYFWCGLDQLAVSLVPASTIQVQSIHVDPLGRGACYLLSHHLGHLVVDNDAVQGPPLVGPRHLLSHGRHKPLGVEEPRHPETAGAAFKHPATELGVSLQQLCVPETNGGGIPRDLCTNSTIQ